MTLVNRFSECCGLFEFDIATPLFDQLAADFELLTPDPLQPESLETVESRPGLYGLHHQGSLVYVGKADESARERLRKHRRQLEGRIGMTPEEVSFRCLHFAHTWDPFKPESHMIRKYSPSWNLRGFGPNDPGRMRDKTRLKDNHGMCSIRSIQTIHAREFQRETTMSWSCFDWCARRLPIGFASKATEAEKRKRNNSSMKKPIVIFPRQGLFPSQPKG